MSDTALNAIIQYGTQADRITTTPDPAVGSQVLYLWYETDNPPDLYVWDGSAWVLINGVGSGGITQLTGDVTAGPGVGSQVATIANDVVVTAKILNANVTYAKIQDVSAASKLLGRGSAGGAGVTEEITLGTNLSMSGTTLNASGSGGGSGLLASTVYSPGTQTVLSTTSATLADVDAANLSITFTVPASGNVLVRLGAYADVNINGQKYAWSLREGSTDITGAGGVVTRNDSGAFYTLSFIVTGLTPSASVTYKWSHACDQLAPSTGRLIVHDGGINFAGALMEVWEAP